MRSPTLLLAAALLGASALAPASAATLRIGLQEDPDQLDPDLARTFVGRIVFASLCDKLIDIDPELTFVPMLATDWSWSDDGLELTMDLRQDVVFHDGTPFDAEALKFNIERSKELPGSRRASELTPVESVAVVDKDTATFRLSEPFVPLLAALADRAGMMVSPTAVQQAEEAGEDFALNPVCAGPFQFKERVQQDRIVLERFDDYWNADEIFVDEVVFLPIPDTTVRLANLQAGDLDIIERAATQDLEAIRQADDLRVEQATGLGYQGITFNVGNGPRADGPLGSEPKLREAFELAIDRNIINQVAFNGEFMTGNQPVPPTNPYYAGDLPAPERDVERAKQLIEEAGYDRVPVELLLPNNPVALQVGQIVQSMAAEAGFDVTLNAVEFATSLQMQTNGDFEAFLIGWSGRVDPDGNIHTFTDTEGGLNDGKYSNAEVDRLINEARTVGDVAERKQLYADAAKIYLAERPRVYLYHVVWFWGVSDDVSGFTPYPDGMIRPQGIKLEG